MVIYIKKIDFFLWNKKKNEYEFNLLKNKYSNLGQLQSALIIHEEESLKYICIFEYNEIGEFYYRIYRKEALHLQCIHSTILLNSLMSRKCLKYKFILNYFTHIDIMDKEIQDLIQQLSLISEIFHEIKENQITLYKMKGKILFIIERDIIFIIVKKETISYERYVLTHAKKYTLYEIINELKVKFILNDEQEDALNIMLSEI